MTWRDEYLTGNELVDEQHQRLFALIASVRSAVRERRARPLLVPALEELGRYVDDHFEDEERLMRRAAYPALGEHRRAHDAMRDRTAELTRGFLDGELVMPITLSQFLTEWFVAHVRHDDLLLARWLSSARLDAAGPAGASA